MAFSEETKNEIFRKSGGRCECKRLHPGMSAPHHGGRCSTTFTRHGGQWEAHHIVAIKSGGNDAASNGEALCLQCHKLTETYGS